MLRTNLLLLIAILFSSLSFAQPTKGERQVKKEKIRAQKIAFISTHLDLTPDEAKLFWPIYNQYETAINTIRRQRRSYHKSIRKSENLSDEQVYEMFELIFDTEIQESKIRLDYLARFSEVLGKKKAANVFIAEEKFKHELLGLMKKEGHPPPPHGGGHH